MEGGIFASVLEPLGIPLFRQQLQDFEIDQVGGEVQQNLDEGVIFSFQLRVLELIDLDGLGDAVVLGALLDSSPELADEASHDILHSIVCLILL